MKVVGCLCWWDESPSWLATAVAGFARVCDHIVAVDGAYALFPGARARSRPDQAEAVLQAAEAAGASCTVHRPNDVFWGNEVEKRNLSLQLAAPHLTHYEDWVCVFDADMHVLQVTPEAVRRDLAETDQHVATYTVLDGQDLLALPGSDLAVERDVSTEWTVRMRHIYRWLPNLKYGPAHYSVSGNLNGDLVWLRGGERDDTLDPLQLESSLVVHHRRQHRAKVRRDAADGYLHARDHAGVERVEDIDRLVI